MKNILTLLLLCHVTFAFAQSGSVKVVIQPMFNNELLKLETKQYVNAHGDSLYIDEFKFYLSCLKLTQGSHTWAEKESYHLIDAADESSYIIYLKDVPAATYDDLDLLIGVDSIVNVRGANDGDLDPIKGMFWTWNTGYIMAKLQGTSNACKRLHHAYEFHIGGYLPPNNAARSVKLDIAGLKVEPGKESIVYIKADAAEWFKSPDVIDLSMMNEVNMPGKNAMRIADNYKDMLRIK